MSQSLNQCTKSNHWLVCPTSPKWLIEDAVYGNIDEAIIAQIKESAAA